MKTSVKDRWMIGGAVEGEEGGRGWRGGGGEEPRALTSVVLTNHVHLKL